MRVCKFRIYPSKAQEKEMNTHLWRAKNLWNKLLEFTEYIYDNFGLFPTKNTLQLMAKKSGLFSQTEQEISHRLLNSIWRMVELRKKGIECGFPRYKSFQKMKSIHYPQAGFKLGRKLKVSPFGELSIIKHREIKGEIKTLSIKREPSGKWFACFCVEEGFEPKKTNTGKAVGIDLGLKTFASITDGTTIENPRHLKQYEEKLARVQRQFSKCKKGSNNKKKLKRKVAVIEEKIANTRHDFLQKTSTKLVNSYSFIGVEKLAIQEMAEQNYGKNINDAGWGMFSRMLAYKAESAGCEVVFVNPENTSQECSKCHQMVWKDLSVRVHQCPHCGLVLDRDLNAANNILTRALHEKDTAGHVGINACGELTSLPQNVVNVGSMNQEASTNEAISSMKEEKPTPFRGGSVTNRKRDNGCMQSTVVEI